MASLKRVEHKSGRVVYRIVICMGYDKQGNKLVKNLTYSVNQSATPKQQEKEALKYAMDMEDKLKYGYDFNAEKMSFEDAYAITNKRVIMAQQRVIGQVVQSVLLKNLNDITANSGLALGVITIDTIKEKFNVCVDSRSANKICEKVHEVLLSMEDSRTTQPQVQIQQNSSADEILKYKNLLDMGVITQEEFEQKKKQLLGL